MAATDETASRAELALDGAEIVAQQIKDFFRRRYGQCAHSCWLVPVPFLVGTIVRELHVDAEVVAPKQSNDFL